MKRVNDFRARNHPSYWAFLVHRVSGLLLVIFLPIHFLALSLALKGDAALNGFISFTDTPLFKVGELGLVVLLTLHLVGGVRLLLIDFHPVRPPGLLKHWIYGGAAMGLAAGAAFVVTLNF